MQRVCADSKEVQFRRSDDHGASKRKEGWRREDGQAREEKGNRREKKEIAAARRTGKTETALNSVVSLPTFANSRPFVLHLEAEEVGHGALFPFIRSSPSPVLLSATIAGAIRVNFC